MRETDVIKENKELLKINRELNEELSKQKTEVHDAEEDLKAILDRLEIVSNQLHQTQNALKLENDLRQKAQERESAANAAYEKLEKHWYKWRSKAEQREKSLQARIEELEKENYEGRIYEKVYFDVAVFLQVQGYDLEELIEGAEAALKDEDDAEQKAD